jgi:hypothetical protein
MSETNGDRSRNLLKISRIEISRLSIDMNFNILGLDKINSFHIFGL